MRESRDSVALPRWDVSVLDAVLDQNYVEERIQY